MRARKWLLAAVGIAGFAFIGKAQADTLEIGLSLNGGPITTEAIFTGTMPLSGSYSTPVLFPFDGFQVTVTTGTSVNANHSFLINSTALITNVSAASTDALNVWVTENNYTLPAGSLLNVSSGFTDTVVPPDALNQNNVYQAYADNGNGLYGTGGFTNGLQSALTQSGNQHSTSTVTGLFNRTGADFSLTSVANISGLGVGDSASYTSQVDVTVAPLPVSASTGLALLAGLGVFAGVSVLRRRRQMA